MPLFQSKSQKAKDFFNDLVLGQVRRAHEKLGPHDPTLARFFGLLIMAGGSGALSTLQFQPFAAHWEATSASRESKIASVHFLKVFTVAMAARCIAQGGSFNVDEWDPAGALDKLALIQRVLVFFADHDENNLAYFNLLTMQHIRDTSSAVSLANILFLNEAVNTLGARRARPPLTQFPFRSFAQMTNNGVEGFDFAIHHGVASTLDYLLDEMILKEMNGR